MHRKNDGRTAISLAAGCGHSSIVQILLEVKEWMPNYLIRQVVPRKTTPHSEATAVS